MLPCGKILATSGLFHPGLFSIKIESTDQNDHLVETREIIRKSDKFCRMAGLAVDELEQCAYVIRESCLVKIKLQSDLFFQGERKRTLT